MKILSLDPSGTTGYAVAIYEDEKLIIEDYGIIPQIESKNNNDGKRCNDLYNKVFELIKDNNPDLILIEDYHFSGRFAMGSSINVAFRAAIWMACDDLNKEFEIINESQWKKSLTGRSRPNKVEKKKYGATNAKKSFIQQALYSKYNLKFPGYRISPKTGKPIKPLSDYVDAVAFILFYLKQNQMNIKKVISNKEFDESIQVKGSFIYD